MIHDSAPEPQTKSAVVRGKINCDVYILKAGMARGVTSLTYFASIDLKGRTPSVLADRIVQKDVESKFKRIQKHFENYYS